MKKLIDVSSELELTFARSTGLVICSDRQKCVRSSIRQSLHGRSETETTSTYLFLFEQFFYLESVVLVVPERIFHVVGMLEAFAYEIVLVGV